MTVEKEYNTSLFLCGIKGLKIGMGSFGIEIETESRRDYAIPDSVLKYWRTHSDGSLRNIGVEYVLKEPLFVNEVDAALKAFDGMNKIVAFEKSTYTSVHVHLNFVDKSLTSLANFIVLYVLFENMLTRYCGPDRDGNLFCLKGSDSEASIDLYKQLIDALASGTVKELITFIYCLNNNVYKYSALNIVPLKNLGSVEVRTHPGTTNIEEIGRWVAILNCLYEVADKYRDPREIVRQIRDRRTYIPFVNHIFGSLAKYFDEKTIDEDINRNLYYMKYMLYNVKDWSTFGKFEKPKELFRTYNKATDIFVDAGMTQYARGRILSETVATEDI